MINFHLFLTIISCGVLPPGDEDGEMLGDRLSESSA